MSIGEMDRESKTRLTTGLADFSYFETEIGGIQIFSVSANIAVADLIFERTDDARECVFKILCLREGVFGLMMDYQNRNLDESLGDRPVLNFTETCCREIVAINNVLQNDFENNNYHLIENDLSDWSKTQSGSLPLDFTSDDMTSRGFFLLEVVE